MNRGSTNRRRVLAGMAAAAVPGCTGALPFGTTGDDTTVLGPPERRRGSPTHPIHGEVFPEFSAPDALTGEDVTREVLLDDGPAVFAFIYTSCPDRCGEIMGLLSLIQRDATAGGWADDVTLAALTIDPKTDDPETLRRYAADTGVDADADNVRLLRPETEDEAIDLVAERFGVPAQHGHEPNDHDDHDHGEDGEDILHYYMVFLINADGIVERSYPGPVLFALTPNDVVTDVREVATAHATT